MEEEEKGKPKKTKREAPDIAVTLTIFIFILLIYYNPVHIITGFCQVKLSVSFISYFPSRQAAYNKFDKVHIRFIKKVKDFITGKTEYQQKKKLDGCINAL